MSPSDKLTAARLAATQAGIEIRVDTPKPSMPLDNAVTMNMSDIFPDPQLPPPEPQKESWRGGNPKHHC